MKHFSQGITHGMQVGGSNVKNSLKPKTYNPGKRDLVQNIIGYSIPTVVSVYGLLKWPYETFWLILMFVFVVLDVICVYYMLRDPTCKTFITIDSEGAHIFFSNMEKTIFHGVVKCMLMCASNRDTHHIDNLYSVGYCVYLALI